jgi:hypothetical protein
MARSRSAATNWARFQSYWSSSVKKLGFVNREMLGLDVAKESVTPCNARRY